MADLKVSENKSESVIVNHSIFYRTIKRLADIILSIIALIVLMPVFVATAVAIKIEDKGPVFFCQDRAGKDGQSFLMYKFRSMCVNAQAMHKDLLKMNELKGPAFKMKDDPRVTRVGRFIRRTSIDELPQLINIIKGEMSIVGPRPLPTYENDKLNEFQKQRLLVKPGLTCYWQVSGRNDIEFDDWMNLDIKYINDASIWTDLKLIGKTFGAVLSQKGAS